MKFGLHPGAWRFARNHALLLLCYLAIAWLFYEIAAVLIVMECVAWLPFVLASPRAVASRFTAFLWAIVIGYGGMACLLDFRVDSNAPPILDLRSLLIALAVAMIVLTFVRQFVFVFKRLDHYKQLRSRARPQFNIFHIMQWTIAFAVLSALARHGGSDAKTIYELFVTGGIHGLVISVSVCFSVWFWMSPTPMSNRFDTMMLIVVLLVPLLGVSVLAGVYRSSGSAFMWILMLVLASIPYTLYLTWVCTRARRYGIRVGGKGQIHPADLHRAPRRVEAIEVPDAPDNTTIV